MSLLPECDLDELLCSARSTRLPDAALREPNVMGECRLACPYSGPSRDTGMGTGEGVEEETVDVEDGRGIV